MDIYNYEPATGVFLSQAAAQPDPLELATARLEDPNAAPTAWLIPANATTVAPPSAPSGQQAVFADGGWSLQVIPEPPEAPAPTTAELWAAHQRDAAGALSISDRTVLRCVEHAVAVPEAWATYRGALRDIVGAPSGDPTTPLPARPAYPAGT